MSIYRKMRVKAMWVFFLHLPFICCGSLLKLGLCFSLPGAGLRLCIPTTLSGGDHTVESEALRDVFLRISVQFGTDSRCSINMQCRNGFPVVTPLFLRTQISHLSLADRPFTNSGALIRDE